MGDKPSKRAPPDDESRTRLTGETPGGAGEDTSDSDHTSDSGTTDSVSQQDENFDPEPVPVLEKPKEVWDEVCERLDIPLGSSPPEVQKVERSGGEWKTVRIFVSSTFKDFHYEREVLVKKVFPELRLWCQKRRLRLIDIDLRWGVPVDATSDTALKLCLEEIDRCENDNHLPYFINLTSLRAGWIPTKKDGNIEEILQKYKCLVFGLSVTEMEIVHGAFKNINPNSLFLLRVLGEDVVDKFPEKIRDGFLDPRNKELESNKLDEMKRRIKDRFEDDQIEVYECTFRGQYDKFGKPIFNFFPEDIMTSIVMDFFKKRIEHQYPLSDLPEDKYAKARLAHDAFVKSKCHFVMGRDKIVDKISNHLRKSTRGSPMVIHGEAGIGKSAVMAKVVENVMRKINKDQNSRAQSQSYCVFYHFVGAVPGSTDLYSMLARLLLELNVVTDATMPSDLQSLVNKTTSVLKNHDTSRLIIIVDAINQFDEEDQKLLLNCVKNKLAPKVTCVISVIKDSEADQTLGTLQPKPKLEEIQPLSDRDAQEIVKKYLGDYKKKLSQEEMQLLMKKKARQNPLWLVIACEELRVIGVFRYTKENNTIYVVKERITELKDTLPGILGQMLDRFMKDGTEEERLLLTATVSLLEVSVHGLLETELLFLLSDLENLDPTVREADHAQEKGEKEQSERENPKFDERLPHRKWVTVQRTLGTFLRPFGDTGEGRLDFYHRAMSKVVRDKYLQSNETKLWWHRKLADYFERCTSDDIDRKIEEYPIHLIEVGDIERLRRFLGEWPTLEKLLSNKLSTKLLEYWRKCGSYEDMQKRYTQNLTLMEMDSDTCYDTLGRRQLQVARILLQIEKYEEAWDLTQKCLENEQKKLGSRPERLAEIYSLMADIWGEKSKQHAKIGKEQAPEIEKCMKYNEMAEKMLIKLLKPGAWNQNDMIKARIGQRQIKRAFALVQQDQLPGTTAKTPSGRTCKEECQVVIDEATEIFRELGDNEMLVELKLTEAESFWRKPEKKAKRYSEAWELCVKFVGKYDLLSARIQHNWGIACAKMNDPAESYRHYKISHIIKQDLYGPDHPETIMSYKLLERDKFKKIHDANKLQIEINTGASF